MEKSNKMLEQEQLFFDSLEGDEKREYFTTFLISELLLSLVDKRKEEKITQKELAKTMGVKQAYISKIENLAKIPTIETIAKYIYALNFSLSCAAELSSIFVSNFKELSTITDCLINLKAPTKSQSEDFSDHRYVTKPLSRGRLAAY